MKKKFKSANIFKWVNFFQSVNIFKSMNFSKKDEPTFFFQNQWSTVKQFYGQLVTQVNPEEASFSLFF